MKAVGLLFRKTSLQKGCLGQVRTWRGVDVNASWKNPSDSQDPGAGPSAVAKPKAHARKACVSTYHLFRASTSEPLRAHDVDFMFRMSMGLMWKADAPAPKVPLPQEAGRGIRRFDAAVLQGAEPKPKIPPPPAKASREMQMSRDCSV